MTNGTTAELLIDPSMMGTAISAKRMETLTVSALRQLLASRTATSVRLFKPSHITDKGDFWLILRNGREGFCDLLAIIFEGDSDQHCQVVRLDRTFLRTEQIKARAASAAARSLTS